MPSKVVIDWQFFIINNRGGANSIDPETAMEIQETKYDLGDTIFGLAALAVVIAPDAAAAAV